MNKQKKVGHIDTRIIELVRCDVPQDSPIYLGESNVLHMKQEHPNDFQRYAPKLENILASPTYVAKHPNKDSIEYIGVFNEDGFQDYVLVAVRPSKAGVYYVRSLFVMSDEKVEKYMKKGALLVYEKEPMVSASGSECEISSESS